MITARLEKEKKDVLENAKKQWLVDLFLMIRRIVA
jgi:hypothetical protein